MKECYIRYMAHVNPKSIDILFKVVDAKIREKTERIHLLLSSPGGSVFHGISIYNFLKGIPVEVFTYNFGSVDSIGVVIFCSGSRRFSVPNARFLIHGVKMNFQGAGSFDEWQLHEHHKSVKIDQLNIARIIADTTGKPTQTIEQQMHDRMTLNPTEAKDYGLVHEISHTLLPVDADFIPIYEGIVEHPAPKQIIKAPTPAPAAERNYTESAHIGIVTI